MPSGDNNKGKKHVGIPINSRPIEEARKIQSMGGIASGVAKRKKKLIKETLEMCLDLKITEKAKIDKLRSIGIEDEDMTNQTLIALGVIARAKTGDPYAATFIRDSIGQKEADKLEIGKMAKEVIADIENYVDTRTD